jgi:hypothetical protein
MRLDPVIQSFAPTTIHQQCGFIALLIWWQICASHTGTQTETTEAESTFIYIETLLLILY